MKAKLIDRQTILHDYKRWNDDYTAFGLASDSEEGYFEFIPSDMPADAVKYKFYSSYYEKSKSKIYQKWELLSYALEDVINMKLAEIDAYDTSSAVNEFYMGGMSMWIDRDTRASLLTTITAEEANGRTTTTIWTMTTPPFPVELPIVMCRALLQQLEVYAKDAFGVTQQHKAAVCQLTTIDDIEVYDHTADYPEKLTFNPEL